MRLRLLGLLAFFSVAILLQAEARQSEHLFTTNPTISPNGDFIIFSFESDLWRVSSSGGTATRITAMDGFEYSANISPDGNWVAFTSDQFGNPDVYVMPVEGGEITRLTFHQAFDVVSSWSWDSDKIYFTSNRFNRATTYSISINGGTPKRLFGHYHNTVHNIVEHPSENAFYFNESWESLSASNRKGYQGAFNPNIKSYNLDRVIYTEHTDWIGKDMWPMVDSNGSLYFTSDEGNGEYNLYTLENGSPNQLTNFNTSVRYPKISADGSTIVFEKEYQIFIYDVEDGESQKVPINIFRNNTLDQHQNFDISGNVTGLDVSMDGKKMAFISRGELFVSDIDGKFIRQIPTSPMGRVLEVKWLSDNKTLLFNQTSNGYQNIYSILADGSSTEVQHTSDDRNNRNIEVNSDRTQAVYLSGRDELRMLDLSTFESTTVVTDEFWGFQNTQPYFSPNDQYLLYNAKRNFEFEIYTYEISTGETINLTNTGISEYAPYWSPDGKYIFYSSTITVPTYPRWNANGDFDLFRLALDRYEEPFKTEEFDKLFEESDTDSDSENGDSDDDDEKVEITINTDRIMERAERIGPSFGNQYVFVALQAGDKTMVVFTSDHDEGNTALYVTTYQPFESPSTKKFDGINQIQSISVTDGKAYAIARGSIYKLDVGSASATKIETSHSFSRNLRDEFYQMFDEFWANVEENFYNETFHEKDWKSIRDRYSNYLPFITNRNDFARMNQDMLGELNSSHLGFSTFGPEDDVFFSTFTASTGLLFENDRPYVVSSIVKRGALDLSGKNIRVGDELIAVNGTEIDKNVNREYYFNFPQRASEIALTFKRGRNTHTILVHPETFGSTRTALYDEWVDVNQHLVDRESDERIAYVHMKNMGGQQLQNFLVEMTSEAYSRDALILDLRFNTGGNVHDDVLRFLSQRKYALWKYREAEFTQQSNFTPADKPIILLINEASLSDAEMTTAGFKELGLGTVVGTETYRWIIFTSGKSLVDGSFYRLPKVGVHSLDGTNLEKTGVAPDISIRNTFSDRISGNDPQLRKAIELALEQIQN